MKLMLLSFKTLIFKLTALNKCKNVKLFLNNAQRNLKLATSFGLKKCLDQDIHVGILGNDLETFF